ncbi:hypothetical protein [Microscilla marina]|uniref:ISPg2, transposase, putative n=1 Tax=Microscilla marina ATCC 23134 TaxID=313606 RepID=A1ZE88_MICM2|nr:hypothetical protein [Microscilla marina]EAY31396.1 ISPg2, transposase, putative [Microscilla marina ATCC 23134]
MTDYAKEFPAIDQKTTFDFNHGRVEQRKYWLYDIIKQDFDPRWDETAFKSLVKVQRTRINQKNAKISSEVSYYISNETEKEGIFDAVRNHWSVEVNNHLRNCSKINLHSER